MPNPRNPNRDKAFKLWKKSNGTLKNREIAKKLGETPAIIAKWKCEDKWSEKSLPKSGAPKGNKNAVGNKGGPGAQPRNTLAEKHGAYSKIYFDTLDDDERELLEAVTLESEEDILLVQLQELTIKARRLKRRIKAAEEERGGLSLDGVVRERTPKGEKTTTITTSTFERIIKLESELDKTQGRTTKVVEALMKHRGDKQRLDIEQKKLKLFEQRALGVFNLELEGIEDDDIIDTEDAE